MIIFSPCVSKGPALWGRGKEWDGSCCCREGTAGHRKHPSRGQQYPASPREEHQSGGKRSLCPPHPPPGVINWPPYLSASHQLASLKQRGRSQDCLLCSSTWIAHLWSVTVGTHLLPLNQDRSFCQRDMLALNCMELFWCLSSVASKALVTKIA